LTASGRSESDAEIRIAQALSAVKLKLADDGKTQYLLYLGRREIEGLATVIEKNWDKLGAPATAEGATNSAKRTKKQAAAEVDGGVREALEQVLNGGKAVDVALFGRMLADLPEKNQHAACQVAHAISTHAVEREFDFYTAVDDLKPEDSSGADMMGTIEFNSACFYRYAVIDFEKLIENLQGDSELALTGVRNFVRGFVVAEPTGKQNSFAAHNPPEFVALTIRKTGGPRSYANAFEQAVRQTASSGITRVSADALIAKAKALATAYGAEVDTVILDLTGTETDGFGRRVSTLDELVHEGVARLKAE
jgi:CRISPR system Cascade subunit CasC